MSLLFKPKKIGNVSIKNRFIHSACEDNMASEEGYVTEQIINRLQKLARGEVGLIISSHLSVHPSGRTKKYQAGIYDDMMIDGLSRVTKVVHKEDGKIFFQLGHGGLQSSESVTGQPLMGPVSMTGDQIEEIIIAFTSAAQRAVESGADGIQIHAAHGYLINEFLSPFYNKREDEWGGSDENRFRFLKEIIKEVRSVLPEGFPLIVKLNTNDYSGDDGVTPIMAVKYSGWLKELSIDGLEITCGMSLSSPFNICRGNVPVDEMVISFPLTVQSKMKSYFDSLTSKYILDTPYNVDAVKLIRPVFDGIPLFAVGGWRVLAQMEEAVSSGETDFISMCRPLIREPNIVKKIREGKTKKASCKNCNKCLAALPNNLPVRCYYNGLPH